MTTTTIKSIGFCAHYSKQGDWAFKHALALAQERGLQLNVFHFLKDPYDPSGSPAVEETGPELERLARDRERELRLYYDDLAGEYLNIGFRLCVEDSWKELHGCLLARQFQVLFLAHPGFDAYFCGKPIDTFAETFVCPIVLVGPHSPTQFRLNGGAALIFDQLGLAKGTWSRLDPVPTPR
ncbi:MAG: hypothetical protein V2A76_03095 [Planctomycetota bacterium]